jgi:hypothetical protein
MICSPAAHLVCCIRDSWYRCQASKDAGSTHSCFRVHTWLHACRAQIWHSAVKAVITGISITLDYFNMLVGKSCTAA